MLPLGADARREGRVRGCAPATAIPRQFGPISRAPCARTSASSRSCRSAPSRSDLREPGRDDDERANAGVERLARRPSSTAAAGSAITARSTGSGISATDA